MQRFEASKIDELVEVDRKKEDTTYLFIQSADEDWRAIKQLEQNRHKLL